MKAARSAIEVLIKLFQKFARWSRGGSSRSAERENSFYGISFLQSFFLCACGSKEKSVKRQENEGIAKKSLTANARKQKNKKKVIAKP